MVLDKSSRVLYNDTKTIWGWEESMKNKDLEKISELTGSSKSAVSKALNHCFGVDLGNRERILSEARREGICAGTACDVYVILPDRPHGFWNAVMDRLIVLKDSCRCKFNICPSDSPLVLCDYIDEAKRLGARLILMCTRPCERQRKLLEKSTEIPVIFLFHEVNIVNTFVIGADAYADGRVLGSRLQVPDGVRILLLTDGSMDAKRRAQGFLDGAGASEAVTVTLGDPNASAASIARAVSGAQVGRIDVVYACGCQLREAAMAAIKLGMRDCVAVGHDYMGEARTAPLGTCTIGCVKCLWLDCNIEAICRRAVAAAIEYITLHRFPDRKYIRIPSYTDNTN